jgi:hypothetical protein
MKEIDFLPARYREQHAQRKKQFWRLVVVAAYAALLCAAAWTHTSRRRQLEAQVKAAAVQHAAVSVQGEQLARLQEELRQVQAEAELYTYLRHPWPRTQILAAIVSLLPKSAQLEELRLQRQQAIDPAAAMLRDRARAAAANPGEAKPDTRPLARRDLEALQEIIDESNVAVSLAGVTTDEAALHIYLGQLGDDPLFAKVELVSLERMEGKQGVSRFRARAMVVPGYGQPRGPQRGTATQVASKHSEGRL